MNVELPGALTIDDFAAYLRLLGGFIDRRALQVPIPSQKVRRHWRFLRGPVERLLETAPRILGTSEMVSPSEVSLLGLVSCAIWLVA